MGCSSLLSLTLCFLLLFHGGAVQAQRWSQRERQRQRRSLQDECQLDRITALEPSRRIQSEAGVSEIWDQNDQQFQCAGVIALRHTIQERGLLLPQYVNGPKLLYVVQGRGVHGAVYPGCPETYQSSESQRQGSQEGEQHQKVRQIRQGDVVALPEGVAQWVYNNGQSPLVLVQIIHLSNDGNQLDQNLRAFSIAGNPEQEWKKERGEYSRRGERRTRQQGRNSNVFAGIDDELLAEAFNINTELARKLKGENDNRGVIVRVEGELEIISPHRSEEEERREREEERRRRYNGIEETFCTARLKHNIDNPSQADVYNPQAGRVTNVDSFNLPILRHLQLSVQKGALYRNAVLAPHWNINAHSVHYFTEGSGHVQIVDDNGNAVFDGQVRKGRILIAPQNFVVVKKASNEGLEWVAFKTNDNAQISQLAGRVSALRALPDEVVANAYQVSREDARRIVNNRQEVTVFSPGLRSQY